MTRREKLAQKIRSRELRGKNVEIITVRKERIR